MVDEGGQSVIVVVVKKKKKGAVSRRRVREAKEGAAGGIFRQTRDTPPADRSPKSPTAHDVTLPFIGAEVHPSRVLCYKRRTPPTEAPHSHSPSFWVANFLNFLNFSVLLTIFKFF